MIFDIFRWKSRREEKAKKERCNLCLDIVHTKQLAESMTPNILHNAEHVFGSIDSMSSFWKLLSNDDYLGATVAVIHFIVHAAYVEEKVTIPVEVQQMYTTRSFMLRRDFNKYLGAVNESVNDGVCISTDEQNELRDTLIELVTS